MNSTLRLVLLALLILLAATPRLPAPIFEIESPTPSPKPKTSHRESTAHKSEPTPTVAAKERQVTKTPGGPATVFIYRPAGFPWGMYNGAAISIDGAKVRTMADPRYSVRKLSPGKHVFEATGGVITQQRIPIEIDLQNDQTYYFRMSIDAMGFPEGKIIFTHATNAQGAEEIAKLKQGP